MILQSDYPPDLRLTKEIQALNEHNIRTLLLCNNKKNLPRQDRVDEADLYRLASYPRLPALVTGMLHVPLFFNPVWVWHVLKSACRRRITMIHVHDLPLALTAIVIGKLVRKPVVFDVHENYPAALRIWGKKGFCPFLFRNPTLAEKLEKICLTLADAVIVVAEEHRELFISRGVAPQKIFVVSNTVDFDHYAQIRIDPEIIDRYKNHTVLCYVGKFGVERNLDTAILALNDLRAHIPNIKLLIVGEGPNEKELRELARREKVGELVEFTGWVDFSLTASYIQAGAICIIPQSANELIDNGVPHKLFQYMALGKPVLCSDSKALARVINDSACGQTFASKSATSFRDAVLQMLHSTIPYGENGIRAIASKYNWQQSARELVRLYDTFAQPLEREKKT